MMFLLMYALLFTDTRAAYAAFGMAPDGVKWTGTDGPRRWQGRTGGDIGLSRGWPHRIQAARGFLGATALLNLSGPGLEA